MQVKELIDLLNKMPADWKVAIDDSRYGTIGPSPKVGVMRVVAGFDWDNGTVVIYPGTPMTSLDKDTVNAMIEFAHKEPWRQNYLRQISELESKIKELKNG